MSLHAFAGDLLERLGVLLPELTAELLEPLLLAANDMPSEFGQLEPVISLGVLLAMVSELAVPGREELQLLFDEATTEMNRYQESSGAGNTWVPSRRARRTRRAYDLALGRTIDPCNRGYLRMARTDGWDRRCARPSAIRFF